MAIQVSGTTVIDDSKHLTNISGYSGHQAGFHKHYPGTGVNTDFRISNMFTGKVRLIVSGDVNYPNEGFFAVFDVFGNLNANNTILYDFTQIANVFTPANYFSGSKTNTYFQARGIGGYNNNLQYNYTWDLYYNIGNHTSIPTLTIVDS